MQLIRLVQDASQPGNTDKQVEVLTCAMKRLLGGHEPHKQQVQVLHQLVYQIGDTMLIAKTGFGKSIIFHAFSVLTGLVTIQLIPLSKLGEEQASLIHRLPGTNPCLVTAETKFQNPGMLNDIQRGNYTHILLGPEQAVSPEFRKILQDPNFQQRVGLVVIDECHVLSQWQVF